jgi:uncharacterized protein YdhG (YjbR/CyaY superfamily)
MKTHSSKIENVDAYIDSFPKLTQKLLKQMRAIIKKAAPKADEVISYQMPAYKFHGMLVYFAGYEHHIGFYPGASIVDNFKKDISGYKTSKGTIQFPLDEELPVKLITKIIAFRIKQNMEKEALKAGKKKAKK